MANRGKTDMLNPCQNCPEYEKCISPPESDGPTISPCFIEKGVLRIWSEKPI